MHLNEILREHEYVNTGVPDWMLGYFKRRSISFANGNTDTDTHVCWLQSRNFTIDLRLPIEAEQVPAKPWQDYSREELRALGNYEGWIAESLWDGKTLAWENEVGLQLHGRWQEPAYLQRIGNCMMEFCPSDAYVEDWRLQASRPGPLIGLRLLQEKNLACGTVTRTDGGLIICGDYAALVLARPQSIASDSDNALRRKAQDAVGDAVALQQLFDFETSVAHGSLADGFCIELSTQPARVGETLCSLQGFDVTDKPGVLRQTIVDSAGRDIERLFAVDTLESEQAFTQSTNTTAQANQWFERESETLCRYTKPCY